MAHSPPFEPSISGKLVGASADRTPFPKRFAALTRACSTWCEWLGALATDAEAALAAAIAYRELDAQGRTSWLNALEQDSVRLKVPRIAVYAPLLAVESDPNAAIASPSRWVPPRSRRRRARPCRRCRRGTRMPASRPSSCLLYLDFVQVLACGYRPERGFSWVRHDPIVDAKHAPRPGRFARWGNPGADSTRP